MRPLEITASLIALLTTVVLILAPGKWRAYQVSALLLLLALTLQGAFEGPHWQMAPLYAASLMLILLALFGTTTETEGNRDANNGTGKTGQAAQDASGAAENPNFRKAHLFSASLATMLVLATIALSWVMPMFRLPAPTGRYAVGTRIMHLVDSSRIETGGPSPSGKRELMVQAWYPIATPHQGGERLEQYQRAGELTAVASYRSVLKTHSYLNAPIGSDGPYPLVLYNPGWQGERTEGTYQAEELASHGFLVIAVDHTYYGGRVEFPDGRIADSSRAPELGSFDHATAEQQAALGAKYVHIEADDDSFVLSVLEAAGRDPESAWYHRIKTEAIGVMGFSIGGAVAAQMALQDDRVKSALNLDGWSFGDVQSLDLAKPWMILYEDRSRTLPTEDQLKSGTAAERAYWKFSRDDFDRVTRNMRAHGGWILFLTGTQHVDFTDRSLFSPLRRLTGGGTLEPFKVHAIVNAYTLAFFSHTLKGTDEPLLEEDKSPYPAVQITRFASPAVAQPSPTKSESVSH